MTVIRRTKQPRQLNIRWELMWSQLIIQFSCYASYFVSECDREDKIQTREHNSRIELGAHRAITQRTDTFLQSKQKKTRNQWIKNQIQVSEIEMHVRKEGTESGKVLSHLSVYNLSMDSEVSSFRVSWEPFQRVPIDTWVPNDNVWEWQMRGRSSQRRTFHSQLHLADY